MKLKLFFTQVKSPKEDEIIIEDTIMDCTTGQMLKKYSTFKEIRTKDMLNKKEVLENGYKNKR